MDWVADKRTALDFLRKYAPVVLVLLVGIVLLVFPEKEEKEETVVSVSQEVTLQESLEAVLSEISGAGRVSLLLTQAAGEETVYQSDENISDGSSRRETVLVSGSGREETGLIRQVKPPTYLGAVVVCEGADNAAVQLAIVKAVRSATGLTTDRISVLKMK